MMMKYLNKWIVLLLLISNLSTFIFAFYFSNKSEMNRLSNIYKRTLAQYAVYLENKDTKTVQKIITMPIFFDISKLGEKNQKEEYRYLCDAWEHNLDKIIKNGLVDASDIDKIDGFEEKLEFYSIGADKLDKLCKIREQ